MKLYWGPHTCALGIHVLLEEIGKPYETAEVDVIGGESGKPPFLAVNPKGKVPVLVRDDGSTLTEFGAIATWLARTNPDHGLLPDNPEDEARALEIMDYAIATLHMQGVVRMIAPEKVEPKDALHSVTGLGKASLKQEGATMVDKAFGILDTQLAGKLFASGPRFGVADAALFYCERWAPSLGVTLPPNVQAHFERMKARGAVQRALAAEGETL